MRKLFITLGASAVVAIPTITALSARPNQNINFQAERDVLGSINSLKEMFTTDEDLSKITSENFESVYVESIIKIINAAPTHGVRLHYRFVSRDGQKLVIEVSAIKNDRLITKKITILGTESKEIEITPNIEVSNPENIDITIPVLPDANIDNVGSTDIVENPTTNVVEELPIVEELPVEEEKISLETLMSINGKSFKSLRNSSHLFSKGADTSSWMSFRGAEDALGIEFKTLDAKLLNYLTVDFNITHSEKNIDFENEPKLFLRVEATITIDEVTKTIFFFVDSKDLLSYQQDVDYVYDEIDSEFDGNYVLYSSLNGDMSVDYESEVQASATFINVFNWLGVYNPHTNTFPIESEAWKNEVFLTFKVNSIVKGKESGLSFNIEAKIQKGSRSYRIIHFTVNTADYK